MVMKTYKLEITEHTLDFRFRDIAERCKLGGEQYRKGNIDVAATQARLLADSANELACLLTQIARTMEE